MSCREAEMRFDHVFDVDGHEELCMFTGFEVKFDGENIWWGEYMDHNGDLHYGN